MNNKPKHILVKFTEEERTQIKLIAALRGVSVTHLIRNAVFNNIVNDLKKITISK